MARTVRVLVPVPSGVGLVFDGRTWSVVTPPPAWWLEAEEERLEEDLIAEASAP